MIKPTPKTIPLGVIEGFYGPLWPEQSRLNVVRKLASLGYCFFVYAPKLDHCLRKDWQMHWSEKFITHLTELRALCAEIGIRFGIGLSPLNLHKSDDTQQVKALAEKVQYIDKAVSPDIFCLLFDDMRGDLPKLATRQTRLAHEAFEHSRASQRVLCPTYYSFDPILSRVFGDMPDGYLEELGSSLDRSIDVFWTGEQICSPSYSAEHLQQVGSLLRRKPFLWDNYPVNDDRAMSPFLHLHPFEKRQPGLAKLLCAHAANPMQQAHCSLIALATLPGCYNKPGKSPEAAKKEALQYLLSQDLRTIFEEFWLEMNSVGLDSMSKARRKDLQQKLFPLRSNPFAKEVLEWLEGKYAYNQQEHAQTQ
jgi:hypothetical protein